MGGVVGDFLLVRNGGPPFHAGNDDRLADAGQGVFGLQGRRGATERTDAGDDVEGDVFFSEDVHLFANGPVDRRISRMQTDRHPAQFFRRFHSSYDVF